MRHIIAAAIIVLAPLPAAAAVCTDTDPAIMLNEKYGESALFTGTTAGHKMTFYVDLFDGSWTVIMEKDGTSCLVASGEDFDVNSMAELPEPEVDG